MLHSHFLTKTKKQARLQQKHNISEYFPKMWI